jgi:hypothetical protein
MKKLFISILFISNLISYGQLTNLSFENWTTQSGSNVPTGWSGSGFGVDSTNDASNGNKALVVWTWYNYAPGFLTNGTNLGGFGDFSNSGNAFSQKPLSLTGMYKFDTTNIANYDSALIVVYLKKYNVSTNQRDTVALGIKHLEAANTYTPFTVLIEDKMQGVNPDSICIIISSKRSIWESLSSTNNCRSPFMDCAYFTVDDLQINLATGSIELSELFSPSVFPNPAKDYLSFKYKGNPNNEQELIYVFDNTGKECYKKNINSISNKLNTLRYSANVHIYIYIYAHVCTCFFSPYN